MAKFSERRRYVSRVIQPSTRSTLGEYDSRPPLARYVWYFTSYLRSSCCSETHVRPRLLPVFLPLSTLDVTHVRRCTRPSPLYRTKQRRKAGRGTGNEANVNRLLYMVVHHSCSSRNWLAWFICMYTSWAIPFLTSRMVGLPSTSCVRTTIVKSWIICSKQRRMSTFRQRWE